MGGITRREGQLKKREGKRVGEREGRRRRGRGQNGEKESNGNKRRGGEE